LTTHLGFTFEDITEEEVQAALEVGAEEAGLHARRSPGKEPCAWKFCSYKSHHEMARRAAILDAMADQSRYGTEAIRVPVMKEEI
jgi:hypothetical protein